MYWLLVAVVITTAIFLFFSLKMKQNELRKMEQLFLQFIDQFEEQYEQLHAKVENLNSRIEALFEANLKPEQEETPENYVGNETLSISQKDVVHDSDIDPLLLQERFSSIVKMIKSNLSVEEIAKKTGKGQGEIRLIIELLHHNEMEI